MFFLSKRAGVILFVVTFFFAASVLAQSEVRHVPHLLSSPEVQQAALEYAERTMAEMSKEERVAQLIMPMLYPKEDQKSLAAWDRMVETKRYGGVLWQKGTPDAQLRLTNRMRQRAKVPMLVTMDGEWGLSMRLSGTTPWPRNMVIGATNSTDLAFRYGKVTAQEAKRMGIHVNFAPVLDVNSNPKNPVIGTRALGSSSQRVTDLGLAYAAGLETMGVLSCAKHFPGHGDTDRDSHKTLPLLSKSRDDLEAVELKPFRAYIEAGLGGMMVAHLNVPALDSSGLATSASRLVTTDLLQRELGFEGLIFTDGLGMQGILEGTGGKSVAVEVFKAGSDILLAPQNPDRALSELMTALERGEIEASEVDRRCKKVLVWKYVLGVAEGREPLPLAGLSADLNPPSSQKLLREIYEKAVTLVKNKESLLPLTYLKGKKVALLRYGNTRTPQLLATLREGGEVAAFTLTTGASASEHQRVYDQLRSYDVVLVAVTSEKAHEDEGLVRLAEKTPLVLSFFTSPYTALNFRRAAQEASAVAFGYNARSDAQRALGRAVLGKGVFEGTLPVDLAPLFSEGTSLKTKEIASVVVKPESVGMRSNVLAKIDEIAVEGVKKGAYPGCQVLVAKDGKVVYHKAFGHKDAARKEKNNTETLYDLASVTKAVVTTPLVMMAVDEGWLKTSDRLGKHLSYLRGSNKEQIRVSDLLFHTGGLPAIIRFYLSLIDPDSYTSPLLTFRKKAGFPIQIARDAWARRDFKYSSKYVSGDSTALFPHRFANGLYLSNEVREMMRQEITDVNVRPSRYRYSDIDFLLLQDILEMHYEQPLDQLFYEKIADPLGAIRLRFKPYQYFSTAEIAEGQRDDFLRKQTLRGDVDDEAAAMLGGVSGNAGLFGNAQDLLKVLQMLLNNGFYDGERYIQSATVQRFTTAKHRTSPYALGFDRHRGKGKKGNTAVEAPLSTYGHTGFTGTCFWIDPENDIIYIFLSNRVAPTRWNGKLSSLKIRTRIQSLIYEALQ